MKGAILVTGAAGFIGSALVRHLRRAHAHRMIVSYDALTYAGRRANLAPFDDDPHHTLVIGDVADAATVAETFARYRPTTVFHLAAETHVDRSIEDPLAFVRTNVHGTAVLLRAAREAWTGQPNCRFVQVSTDEVYGALGAEGVFDESSPVAPTSPYSASKAAADHLALAWHRTFGFPVMVTRCGNNYGPRQYPEKLIPVVIARALHGEPIPVYGSGANVRDWIHVDDHCAALVVIAGRGQPGATYCVGARRELDNLSLATRIADLVDAHLGHAPGTSRRLITRVDDRPGHDFRYAIDPSRLERALQWRPTVDFDEGLPDTVRWYLARPDWCAGVIGRTELSS